MNRRSYHGKQKFNRVSSDFTVNDFANTEPGKFTGLRLKKGEACIKQMENKDMSEEQADSDVAWFDRDIDDFELLSEDSPGEQEEKALKKPPSKKCLKQKPTEACGNTYPIDLWFLLSASIHPESVRTFALLCCGSNHVVHSVQFWKTLYRRFYCKEVGIPEELSLDTIDCIHGLRARTVRMLHFAYPPLAMKTKTTVSFEAQPHCLVGQRCLLMWHQKVRNCWKFYLRFCKVDKLDLSSNVWKDITSPDFDKWHQDLFYNPNEYSSILEVTCPNYIQIPMAMGLVLNGVYLNVSSASMRYHRLKLVMDSSFRATTAKNQNSQQELVLDPVLDVKVFPWWHPLFAETQSLFLEPES
ncbi:transmembrane protein 183-like [Dreissena polymorpha]|uniref:Transmembrane protein 183 n=1 Tax=Dreissena polymorpha TaxID=45954 RepID=A0A9D4S388_DREPO|nr:transmembrane protein 183-like [Dreissena polymorpha]XP_052235719.1 transmembrane protein 183-like [Dreissena polymorpha]XP_052235728.1 transmembrane protein 183-like [Dreissena polymorpha]XP_052235734.1 transmembrane protein 183-like [Dreissena polymorpha]XP_052235742.1 transmembrane protein 183-like [Dreissena polymorpha]XP_052235747.1 transmembrane protein 183-like [Dreissena polymorpha]XP_052235757.1 transmembrane protein 183-like [Dreissena polymorpha]XP_052235766.1 transmembrane pro